MTRLHVTRRLAVLAGAAAMALSAGLAHAQEWPAKPVKLVVPFATGGSADVFGRILAQRLQESLGQSFVVENRPGAGSIIGTDTVAKAAPDGYTLLVMSNTHTVNESLIPNKPFQLMRDFVGVAPINASDLVLVARTALPHANLADLLKAAKAKPDGMTYASSGPGTPYHMAGELLKVMGGVKIVHVPYKGSAQARTDVLGGQVPLVIVGMPPVVNPSKTGKLKMLAVTSLKRSPAMPDVGAVAEIPGMDKYRFTNWMGLFAPAKTPADVVDRIAREVAKVVREPAVQEKLLAQGVVAEGNSTTEFVAFLRAESERYTRIAKERNIRESN